MGDQQGVSRSGLLKLGLAIVVFATALGLGITALIPAGHGDKRASATTTTIVPCGRERVQVDEWLAAQFGPGPVFKGSPPRPPTVAQQELGKAEAKLATCIAALGK